MGRHQLGAVVLVALASVGGGSLGPPSDARASTAAPTVASGDLSQTAGYTVQMEDGARPRLRATVVVPVLECRDIEEALKTSVKMTASVGGYVETEIVSECDHGNGFHAARFDSTETGLRGIDGPVEGADVIKIVGKLISNGGLIRMKVFNQTKGWSATEEFTVPNIDGAVVAQAPSPDAKGGRPVLHTNTAIRGVFVGGVALGSTDYRKHNMHDYDGTLLMRSTDIRRGTGFRVKYVDQEAS